MYEDVLVSRIVEALCDRVAECDKCPVERECSASGNGFEKLVRKCLSKDKKDGDSKRAK